MIHVFEGDHFTPIYAKLIKSIYEKGELEAKTRDLCNIHLCLTNPENSILLLNKRNWRWGFMEILDRLAPLYSDYRSQWNPGNAYHHRPAWRRKLDKEGGVFDYSYGDQYKDQLPGVINLLSRIKGDREAIISVWEPKYLLRRSEFNRRPCTLTLHFFKRGDKLNCHVNMRSNDVVNLLWLDVFHHTFIQKIVAAQLGLQLGYYQHSVSHAYYPKRRELGDRDYFGKLDKKLRDNWKKFHKLYKGKPTKLGSWSQIDHDLSYYYLDKLRNPYKECMSPLLRSMLLYLQGKKIREFGLL